MNLKPQELSRRQRYKITTGAILPRPIAWVGTVDIHGQPNLAPFSFFTVASTEPLTLVFCPQQSEQGKKDTLRNIEATREFVVNIPNEDTAEAMNLTATPFPAGESEFEHVGLTPVPSVSVQAPRVAEAPVAFECTLKQIVTAGSGAVVFGEVQGIYVREDVYRDGYIDLEALKPIGRLAGSGYVRVTDVFEMERITDPAKFQRTASSQSKGEI